MMFKQTMCSICNWLMNHKAK